MTLSRVSTLWMLTIKLTQIWEWPLGRRGTSLAVIDFFESGQCLGLPLVSCPVSCCGAIYLLPTKGWLLDRSHVALFYAVVFFFLQFVLRVLIFLFCDSDLLCVRDCLPSFWPTQPQEYYISNDWLILATFTRFLWGSQFMSSWVNYRPVQVVQVIRLQQCFSINQNSLLSAWQYIVGKDSDMSVRVTLDWRIDFLCLQVLINSDYQCFSMHQWVSLVIPDLNGEWFSLQSHFKVVLYTSCVYGKQVLC